MNECRLGNNTGSMGCKTSVHKIKCIRGFDHGRHMVTQEDVFLTVHLSQWAFLKMI